MIGSYLMFAGGGIGHMYIFDYERPHWKHNLVDNLPRKKQYKVHKEKHVMAKVKRMKGR